VLSVVFVFVCCELRAPAWAHSSQLELRVEERGEERRIQKIKIK
jgi:hypothetical protein